MWWWLPSRPSYSGQISEYQNRLIICCPLCVVSHTCTYHICQISQSTSVTKFWKKSHSLIRILVWIIWMVILMNVSYFSIQGWFLLDVEYNALHGNFTSTYGAIHGHEADKTVINPWCACAVRVIVHHKIQHYMAKIFKKAFF